MIPTLTMTTYILCIGHDETLLKTRQWILERQFRVEVVNDLTGLALLVRRHRFDLVIFCQTLSFAECQQAINVLQAHAPEFKVLNLVTSAQSVERSSFGHSFDPSNGPRAFLACVATILEPPMVVVPGQFVAS
jgi:hypothetical protein